MKTTLLKVSLLAAIATTLIAGVHTVRADQQLAEDISIPTTLSGHIAMTNCSNRNGPVVTLSGEISLGGLQAKIILKNNVQGTHTAEVVWEGATTLLETGETITIPKQPVLGGVGGNPHVWVQFLPDDGEPGDPIYIGRCVQGFNLSADLMTEAWALVDVGVANCNNNPGPWIYLGGDIVLSGLNARFIFTNNARGTHKAQATVDVELISSGSPITVPKQPVLGGATGNPLVYIQFLNGDGTPAGEEILLGRCNQI